MFEVLEAILEGYAMCFQKGMNLETGSIAEQATQLAARELFFAIGLEGNCFEGSPFDIARRGEEAGEVVGKVDGDRLALRGTPR